MIKELLNGELIKLEGIAILNILIEGRNIVSHFLKEGDTLESVNSLIFYLDVIVKNHI